MQNERYNGCVESNTTRYKNALPAFKATLIWIESITGRTLTLNESYRSLFVTGEILCSLMNAIFPGSIRRVNRCPNRASAMDNLTLFLSACEEKCGIPQSTLFSIDDFEDIFERRSETNPHEEKNVQRAEKVAISLFWLARFTDQDPNCAHLPKLDYIAFSGILPRSLILNSLSGYPSEGIASRFLLGKQHHEDLLSNSFPEKILPVVIERQTLPRCSVPSAPRPMGNSDSTPSRVESLIVDTSHVSEPQLPQGDTKASDIADSVHRKASTLPAKPSSFSPQPSPSPSQANNNGLEDDAWQEDLDAWRERRRRTSRLQATKMTSLEEVREAEEKKKQEAIRNRMRQIKSQRTLASSYYIPTSDRVNSVPPSSPGMALLTGSADLNVFDFNEGANEENGNDNLSDYKEETVAPNAEVNAVPLANHEADQHDPDPDNKIISCATTCEPKTQDDVDVIPGRFAKYAANASPVSEVSQHTRQISPEPAAAFVFSQNQYKELKIRVQSVMKSPESRWGMFIRADGPSDTAPFVVDRVKIGSAADICDVTRGDILVQVNNTILTSNSASQTGAITLSTLERLFDQLALENGSIDLRVLRKFSHNDDLSDADVEDESDMTHRVATPVSDVDKILQNSIQPTMNGKHESGSMGLYTETDQSEVFAPASSMKQHMSPIENGSSGLSENRSIGIPLRNSLSAQIMDVSEVGASSLYSSSRVDASSRSLPVSSICHAELTNSEPQNLSIAGSTIMDDQPIRTITVSQTFSDEPTVETIPWKHEDTRCSSLSDLSQFSQYPLDSPTLRVSPLPPPPAPLTSRSTLDLSAKRYPFYKGLQPYSLAKIDSNFVTKSPGSRTVQTYGLPSPPSPTFLGEFTKASAASPHEVRLNDPGTQTRRISDTIIDRSRMETPNRFSHKENDPYSPGQSAISISRTSDLQPRVYQDMSSTARRINPHPPPVAPINIGSQFRSPIDISSERRRSTGNDIREVTLNIREVSNRRSYPPPPPPTTNSSDAPPPPPRVPLNRCIDPKSKCTACTQELGTGDLMIIGSMNLCYHLACFVCSWCGVPLSDGRSNADVRIRMGQLYCQPCYPSKHGHKTVPQGDSSRKIIRERAGTLPARSPVPITCSDRRVRSRGASGHNRRSQPATGIKPTYR